MNNLPLRPRPVWFYMAALCAALTLPILAISAFTTWNFAASEKARLKRDVSDVNLQIVSALERQQAADIAMMRVLASSPALRDGDIASFRVQAHTIIRQDLAGTEFILRDSNGRTLLDTGSDIRGDSSAGLPDTPGLEPDRPAISGMAAGKTFAQSAYFITVPVKALDQIRYYLIARMPVQRLASLIDGQNIDPGYFASIADANGLLLARSAENEKHFGKKLPGVEASENRDFSEWSGRNPQGVLVYGVVRREGSNRWAVTTGIAEDLLHAPLNRSLGWILGLVAATLGVGCILAFAASSVLTGAAQKIIAAANALGEGKDIEPFATPVIDANIVGAALKAASDKLRQQSAALAAAKTTLEHRVDERTRQLAQKTQVLETTLRNMDQGLIVIDEGGNIQLYNPQAADFIGLPESLLATHPNIADTVNFQKNRGDFQVVPEDMKLMFARDQLVPGKTLVHEREKSDGRVMEIRTVPLTDGGLVRTFTDVTLRKHAERHLEFLARHDSLTRLPNRLYFRERLEQAIALHRRHDTPLSVFFIDVDHFKNINDIHGHGVGDALLIEVSARLKSALRMEDTVARFGGDEFAILQAGRHDRDDAIELARRLLESVSGAYTIDDIPVTVGISIGIAACQSKSVSADELMRRADTALYQAKRSGRNRFCSFDSLKIALAAG